MSYHSFDPQVAKEYGLAEAVIIKNFQYWIAHNKRNGRHRHNERTWTYNSARALAEAFTYLTTKQIYGAISRLVEAGVLLKANYNDHKYDRTSWYAFAREDFWIKPEETIHFPARENGRTQSGEPIPDTLTIDYTNKNPPPFSAQSRGDNIEVKKEKTTPAGSKKEKKERPAREFWQAFVNTWHNFNVEKFNGEAPSIVGKQLTELGKLYDLLHLRARRKQAEWSEEYMTSGLKFFLGIAYAEDWLRNHFLLKNLVEQFDAIFAREAQKTVKQKRPIDLQYVVDRYLEGGVDERILTPEIYKKLVDAKLVPEDYWGKFAHGTNMTPEEAKTKAILAWLEQQKPKT